MDEDRYDNDKTVNPHFENPGTLVVKIVLFQNQLWVNRRSILQYFDLEIARVRANHIKGINEYWDDSQIRYLQSLQEFFADLDPDNAEEQLG